MGSGNIVNVVTLSGLGSNTKSLTVTTIPEGYAYPVAGKSYEESVKGILLDRYVLLAVEVFDGEGAYQRTSIEVNFCVTSQDETLTVGVYRLAVGSSEWQEVKGLLKVCLCAYMPAAGGWASVERHSVGR
jgi:hypothetical protein